MEIKDVVIQSDIGEVTIGEFFKALLLKLWREGEGFSGKRPFGNSGWEFCVYEGLIKEGFVEGKLDEEGYVEDFDESKANRLIEKMLKELFE